MIWIEQALVLAIHERQLAEHGGTGGVRDEGCRWITTRRIALAAQRVG